MQGGGQASWTGTCICLTGLLLRPGVLKIFERSFSQFGFSSTFFNPTFSSIPPTADWSELFPAGSVSTVQLGCTFLPIDGSEIYLHVCEICQTIPLARRTALDRYVCILFQQCTAQPSAINISLAEGLVFHQHQKSYPQMSYSVPRDSPCLPGRPKRNKLAGVGAVQDQCLPQGSECQV